MTTCSECDRPARGTVPVETVYVDREPRDCPAHVCRQCGEHCLMRGYVAAQEPSRSL